MQVDAIMMAVKVAAVKFTSRPACLSSTLTNSSSIV
jgi:hypothetical protein